MLFNPYPRWLKRPIKHKPSAWSEHQIDFFIHWVIDDAIYEGAEDRQCYFDRPDEIVADLAHEIEVSGAVHMGSEFDQPAEIEAFADPHAARIPEDWHRENAAKLRALYRERHPPKPKMARFRAIPVSQRRLDRRRLSLIEGEGE